MDSAEKCVPLENESEKIMITIESIRSEIGSE